jgi:hypothetical protein
MRPGPALLRAARFCFCAVAFLALLATSPRAEDVDLLLVLAVDTSGSVNAERFELQKQGYVAAFRNQRLVAAIQAGHVGAVAVTMTQWTGPDMQVHVLPWTRVSDAASAAAVATAIAAIPRQLFGGGTSLSGAIRHAATLFPQAPFTAPRRVIDVSGDGSNNRGAPADEARDAVVAAGITINGLPILALEPELDIYYRDNVIGGPGAFLVAAKSFDNFADAILRKLLTEIAWLDPDQGETTPHMRSGPHPGPTRAMQEQNPCRSLARPCIQNLSTVPGSSSPMAAPPGFSASRQTIRIW